MYRSAVERRLRSVSCILRVFLAIHIFLHLPRLPWQHHGLQLRIVQVPLPIVHGEASPQQAIGVYDTMRAGRLCSSDYGRDCTSIFTHRSHADSSMGSLPSWTCLGDSPRACEWSQADADPPEGSPTRLGEADPQCKQLHCCRDLGWQCLLHETGSTVCTDTPIEPGHLCSEE
jgi:hypothetical protein